MERLTLSQAAERLGISKEAVRQQVHQGVLPHGKWPDGGVYVCLNSKQDKESEESSTADQDHRRSWWDYVAGASGVFVVIGALVYMLGLFSLWVPIARTYTHDLASAWYAASLVPQTVVAGHGVRQVLGPTLFIIIALMVYLALYTFAYRRLKEYRRLLAYVASAMVIGGWLVLSIVGYLSLPTTARPSLSVGYALSVFFLMTIIAVGFAYTLIFWPKRLLEEMSILQFLDVQERGAGTGDKPRLRDVVWGIGWGLLLVFFANFVTAASEAEPALPQVEIAGTSEIEGELLTHTDGFWYVFNQDGELIAIPDDEVKTVWISSAEG